MIGPNVLRTQSRESSLPEVQESPPTQISGQRMDPLSEVLALLKPQSLSSGGFMVPRDMAIYFPKHQGIKCYAMLAGQCWLVVEGVPDPVLLDTGTVFFCRVGCRFSSPRISRSNRSTTRSRGAVSARPMTSRQSRKMRDTLPAASSPLQAATPRCFCTRCRPSFTSAASPDKAAMRWALERLREELRDPQPGSSLMAQQVAYMMLIQALRQHLADGAHAGHGWLSALSDKHMSIAIASMHDDPGHPWTAVVGRTRRHVALGLRLAFPRDRRSHPRGLSAGAWNLAADRLNNSSEGLSAMASSAAPGIRAVSVYLIRVASCQANACFQPESRNLVTADRLEPSLYCEFAPRHVGR